MRAHDTQADVILEALQTAGTAGVTNLELNKICFRYGGRIFELRALGHNITGKNEGKSIWRYTLLPPEPLEQLPLFPKEANAHS